MKTAIKRLFGEEFNNLLFLNLLTVLFCLPVVTIGPTLLALNGTLIAILDGSCSVSRTAMFKRLFREKLGQGVLMEIAFAAYGFALALAVAMADALPYSGILYVVIGFAGMFFLMVSLCVTMILAATDSSFIQAVSKGVLMMLGRLPQVLLGTAAVYGGLFVDYLFYPISVVPVTVIGISAIAALAVGILWPAVYELFLSDDEL